MISVVRNVAVGMLLVVMLAGLLTACAGEVMYENPILPRERKAGADPSILEHDGKYYFYSTNSGLNVFISDDLVHWEKGPRVLPNDFKGIWAPDVYYHPEDGKFYMYYTKHYKIGVAVANKPDGMFKDLGYLAIPAIDAHLFRDDDGRLYLYFTNTPNFDMHCVPMKSPTETGGPVVKCFEISHEWEKHSFPINEGPWMLKRDGIYYLLYSGSDGQSIYYAIGYATAPTPIGPYTKHPGNPVFQKLPEIWGPGHGSIITDRTGQPWHLYHQKISQEKGWARDICLDPMSFDENGVFSGVPTRGEKRVRPNLDPNLVWMPEISPRGALFNNTVQVKITCKTPGATIYYTTDGTQPTAKSKVYDGPLTLNQTALIRAMAVKKSMKNSHIARMAFTQTDEKLADNPSPNAPAGDPPFEVFEKPNPNWVKPQE